LIKPLYRKSKPEKPDEYARDAEDKSRLQVALEWLFHRKRSWARNAVTIGTFLIALLLWSRILGILFFLLVGLRVVGRIYLTVTSTKVFRKIFKARRLRLTNEGWWFVIFTVAIGTAAINTGVNLLYLILSMMLSFILISGILSEITFRKLKITRSLPYSVFAGEQFDATLQVQNQKLLFPSFSLFIEDSPGSGPELERIKACYALKIPARQRKLISYLAKIWRRGPFTFNGYRVHSGYPFSFFVKHMRIPGIDSILVYPRLYELNDTEVLAGGERADALRKLSLRVQGEEDFRGLKEFREGDNPRHIHWVSSARHRKLMVMEFEKQRANRVIVLLDTYLPVGSREKMEALEHGVSTAASLLSFFNKRNYQTGFAAFVPKLIRIKPDSGRRHYFALMEVLARLDPGTRGLEELADRLDARELRDSMVFVVTLKDTLRNAGAIRSLSMHSPVVKHICVTGEDFTRYVTIPEGGPETDNKKSEILVKNK
jgi:uncharacterized protein (DUF58 family)